jgi:4-hydroxy-3-polyprenylbenzoate decarboxylase
VADKGYNDLHEHLALLAERGLLHRIARTVDKDSELHPLVRWQFRGGIPEAERKAFLFESVTDASGRAYDMPVTVAALAGNREIYRLGMGAPSVEAINEMWPRATANPIDPVLTDEARCQETVLSGPDLTEDGAGLESLPIPISTPGWDTAPYVTAGHFTTRDPDTGIQNMGNYRGQLKGPARLGMNPSLQGRPGIYVHWTKQRARGEGLPCALVIGCPPAVTYAAVQRLPHDLDELAVAGGLVGSPIRVVRARTVDLLVPAEAEIVVEGVIRTDFLEPEGPVGESHGHLNMQEYNAVMEVTAITRRADAILPSIISQVAPSESSLIKRVAYEPTMLAFLHGLGLGCVEAVSMHEALTNLRKVVVLKMKRGTATTEVWRALHLAANFSGSIGKILIAVDSDIEADDADSLLWALSYRMRPTVDMRVIDHRRPGHGPHLADEDAAILFDATLKVDFPALALPKREYMERALRMWRELGLPNVQPETPWYGYPLGAWSESWDTEAQLAVDGKYRTNTDRYALDRRTDVTMNDPVD